MKKSERILLSFILIITISSAACYSFDLGFSGGYSKVYTVDYFTREMGNNGLGLDHTLNLAIKAKYPLKSHLHLTSLIKYLNLKNQDTILATPCPESSLMTDIKTKYSMYIISFNAGIEYVFENPKISPYAALNISANYFNELKVSKDPSCSSAFQGHLLMPAFYANPYESKLRMGAGVGIGSYVPISKSVNLDFSIYYDWLKISKKEYQDIISTIQEDDFNTLSFSLGILVNL